MPASTAIYFDSALIAKFYLNEPGRDQVRALAQQAGKVVSSAIALPEVSAAFHRNLRENAIKPGTFQALLGQFSQDLKAGMWKLVPITDEVLGRVQELFASLEPKVYLRSLDAIHATTAKSERFDRIYSNDRHLLAACTHVGIQGVNPLV
jgi:predicted nucleic acid-binding protein